jgi:putative oxidoreductase
MKTLKYPWGNSSMQKYTMLKGFLTALLVLLYTYAAFSKLFDFREFRTALLIQPFPRWAAELLVYLIPLMELLTVLLLVVRPTEHIGYWCSLVLMTEFTGYIALVLAGFWSSVPCSCGGILGHLSWLPHLFFNLFFLVITIAGIFIINQERRGGDVK